MPNPDPCSSLEHIISVIQRAQKHDLHTIAAHIKTQSLEDGFSAIIGAWNTRIAELDASDHGVTKHLDELRHQKETSREVILGRFQKNPSHP